MYWYIVCLTHYDTHTKLNELQYWCILLICSGCTGYNILKWLFFIIIRIWSIHPNKILKVYESCIHELFYTIHDCQQEVSHMNAQKRGSLETFLSVGAQWGTFIGTNRTPSCLANFSNTRDVYSTSVRLCIWFHFLCLFVVLLFSTSPPNYVVCSCRLKRHWQ